MITIKEEKIAEMMFDIWHESDKLKNPVMVGEYIANKLKEAINYTHCCKSISEQLCEYCGLPLQEGVNLDYCKNDYCTRKG